MADGQRSPRRCTRLARVSRPRRCSGPQVSSFLLPSQESLCLPRRHVNGRGRPRRRRGAGLGELVRVRRESLIIDLLHILLCGLGRPERGTWWRGKASVSAIARHRAGSQAPHAQTAGGGSWGRHRLTCGQDGRRRLGRGQHTGQQHVGRLGHDNLPARVLEPRQQTEPALQAAGVVPRQPETVGRAQVRFALMDRQILGREHELFFRRGLARVGTLVVKSVHDHVALDGHGFLFTSFAEEQDPPAEAAHRRLAGLIQRRVGPDRQHCLRGLRFGFRFEQREGFAQVPLGAARHDEHSDGQKQASGAALRSRDVAAGCHRLRGLCTFSAFSTRSPLGRG